MEHLIRINHPNAVSTHPRDGSVLITSADGDKYTIEFASVRHAFDLIGSIADAQGWMLDARERQLADALSVPRITREVRHLA
jgi:hypothetical protein